MKQIKSKIIMLPNNEEAGLGSIYKKINGSLYDLDSEVIGMLAVNMNPLVKKSNKIWEAQYLYFTVDEEIKEPCYAYSISTNEIKWLTELNIKVLRKINWRKVIATTDPKLSLPIPHEDFLKEYCEKSGIDEVMVEYEEYCINNIPKEDHVCVNKNYRPKVFSDNTIIIHSIKDTWNKEEHIADIKRMISLLLNQYATTYSEGDINKWIEENL